MTKWMNNTTVRAMGAVLMVEARCLCEHPEILLQNGSVHPCCCHLFLLDLLVTPGILVR